MTRNEMVSIIDAAARKSSPTVDSQIFTDWDDNPITLEEFLAGTYVREYADAMFKAAAEAAADALIAEREQKA